mgnify:CR=1 FL=1
MGKSWKTTATGVLAIAAAVIGAAQALLAGGPVDWPTVAAAIMAGVGLLMAKDHNVTGGTNPQ